VGHVRVRVDLSTQGYDVVIGEGARRELRGVVRTAAPRAQLAVIVTTHEIAHQSWFDIDPGVATERVIVPDGEAAKRLSVLETVCGEFARHQLSRADVVVTVGGGAVTDLGGFAASVYARGVGVVHVPTSMLAQVDAAIGGKTAVDLAAGKNLVGTFHQPGGVICDTETLATLPARERLSGLGEIAKCLLLDGVDADDAARMSDEELIVRAITLKARIVAADERDDGQRALLNYGHTLAHALEVEQWGRGVGDLRHGEAVAIGVSFAVRLARRLGRVSDDVVRAHDGVLDALSLSHRLDDDVDVAALLDAMGRDKKAHHNLTFVLAGSGGFDVVAGVDPVVVRDELMRFREAG
jgi:5-deoxy-5-amino-3-dehydroquinate synthase